ncbi:outer membrane beta-barrel protein [Candidatus Coxiella mudrowiae]|uniref:Outer membrane protein n=1 Tax=Candidatus Coxiella mudrowiae TaxID=2054173 RepID=A0ABM5UV54_9COXI|nr:outer membrane beta-barrel protein [Candidatus Coxiella mudrowiae]AKQ33864.1 Outer membrane protein [Candidatus Coxiella mudrowiae]
MSVKKIITFATAGIASVGVTSAAVAGGPDYIPAPSYAGVYVEGNVGYVYRPWKSDVTTLPGTLNNLGVLSSSSRGNGGFTFGGDLGYQFNQYFAVEGGWFYLPKAKFTINPTTFTIKGGIPYAALKAMAPIYENTYVFGKLGVAYTYNQSSAASVTSDLINFISPRSNYWNPLFSVGVQYYFTPNWSVNAQYTFVPGYRSASSSRFVAPVADLFTVGIGYKFLM